MKFSTAALFLFVGSASAGTDFGLNLKHGSYGNVQSALAPEIAFSGDSDDIEYGGSVDFASESMPKSIWGKKSTSAGGWNLDAKVEVSQGKYEFGDDEDAGAYVTLNGSDEEKETFVWGSGYASKAGASALKIGAKKVFSGENGKVMVSPRYDADTNTPEVVLGVEKDDTRAYLTLSEEEQDLLVTHKINDDNSASIKAGVSGFISASLTNESEVGTTVVTVTPDDVDVEISKDGWTAGISSSDSITNLATAEPSVRFSKSVDLGHFWPVR